MNANLIEYIYPAIAVATFGTGTYILFLDSITNAFKKYKLTHNLSFRETEKRKMGSLYNHLNKLIVSTSSNKFTVNNFKWLSVLILIFIFTISIITFQIVQSLIIAIAFSLLPYVILRIKLESNRRKSSHEGETLIINILTQYRLNNSNIFETIAAVISQTNELKISKKLLFNLLMSIRNTGNENTITEATKVFAYSINTNWSRMLGNNIQISATRGLNVANSIEDVLIQLRSARLQSEERKRLNSEAVRITIFMIPIMYLATIFISVNYLDMSISNFLENQFRTTQGLILFLISLFMLIINLMIIEIINNKSFDY